MAEPGLDGAHVDPSHDPTRSCRVPQAMKCGAIEPYRLDRWLEVSPPEPRQANRIPRGIGEQQIPAIELETFYMCGQLARQWSRKNERP